MHYFKTECDREIFIIQLSQGDYCLESIEEVIAKENIKDGVVLSGIGTIDYCVLHMVRTTSYPPVEYFKKWEDEALELCSLDGYIADSKPHLHTVVSTKDIAVGGHLEYGCRTLYLCEIVIEKFKGIELERVLNDKNINVLKER